ncbi:MAG: hypothetical protein O3C67_03745 [Cyanobacteria bacterium]|nr:hypothetical protein [Cyanobacteriota bacterium]MDA0867747.1 hypothetical protein [Cyanobacteriota bacterium]
MLTFIRHRDTFAGIVTAVVGVLVGLPFTILHPAVPFTVVLVTFGIVMGLRRPLRLPKYPTAYLAGCLAALVLLLPIGFTVKVAERGFDDGPFYGQVYTDGVTGLEASDRVPYRGGDLAIYNRNNRVPPILAYEVDGDLRWAVALDVSQTENYADYQLVNVSEPQLVYGILRDRLDFLGNWTFGQERGRAYLWKWGGFHRFYLSW